MSAYHVVGLAGLVVLVASLVVLEEIIRRDLKKYGKRYHEPRCAQCGHVFSLHSARGCTHSYTNFHWDTDLDRTRKYNFHTVRCSCEASGPVRR
ncbi:hypothetical protein AB0M10_06730 [Streptomyces sp. NPDC051840]|uniref:hypothetical protein n=1 Tax=unclassified Streptomyces TaxID=2593676 RepID=UPI00342E22FD